MSKQDYTDADAPVNLPILKTIFGCYGEFFNNLGNFVVLGGIFAFVSAFIYIFWGQDISCSNTTYLSTHAICSNNLISFIVAKVLFVLLACVFIRCWSQIVLSQENKFGFQIFKPTVRDLKILGLVFVFFVSLLFAFGAVFLLYRRVPTPDWRIELLYFMVVSLGVFVPIFAFRFISLFGFAAAAENFPKLSVLWNKTKGSTMIIFTNILFLFTVASIFVFNIIGKVIIGTISDNIFIVFGRQYLLEIVTYAFIAIFANFCYIQKQILFERN